MSARPSYLVDPVRVAQARQALDITQADCADRLRVNRVTLNRIENGRARVSLHLLERMAELYGRSREWLCGEPEPLDEIEAGRERIASALAKISEGFEDLSLVLAQRVREAKEASTPAPADEAGVL